MASTEDHLPAGGGRLRSRIARRLRGGRWHLVAAATVIMVTVAGGSTAIVLVGAAQRPVPSSAPPPGLGSLPRRPAPSSGSAPGSAGSGPAASSALVDCGTAPTAPPVGTRVTVRAVLGTVTATLTGTESTASMLPGLAGARIVVTNGDRTLVDEAVRPAPTIAAGARPQTTVVLDGIGAPPAATTSPTSQPLCLAQFPGNDRPTVLLGLYSGGAHCCTDVRFLDVPATGAHVTALDDQVGDPGAHVLVLDGQAAIVTADDTFAYRFTDYAASGLPVLVQQITGSTVADVTRRYPGLVRSDASTWWKSFETNPSDPLGSLAAWTADECVLGNKAAAFTTLDQLERQGRLHMTLPGALGSTPAGAGANGSSAQAGTGTAGYGRTPATAGGSTASASAPGLRSAPASDSGVGSTGAQGATGTSSTGSGTGTTGSSNTGSGGGTISTRGTGSGGTSTSTSTGSGTSSPGTGSGTSSPGTGTTGSGTGTTGSGATGTQGTTGTSGTTSGDGNNGSTGTMIGWWPQDGSYVAALRSFLAARGYCPAG